MPSTTLTYLLRKNPPRVSTTLQKNKLVSPPLPSATLYEDLRINASPRRRRPRERSVRERMKKAIPVHIRQNSSLLETRRFRS
jgi:hypothetical protein